MKFLSFKKLKKIFKKCDIPKQVVLMFNSGCEENSATHIGAIYYNGNKHILMFRPTGVNDWYDDVYGDDWDLIYWNPCLDDDREYKEKYTKCDNCTRMCDCLRENCLIDITTLADTQKHFTIRMGQFCPLREIKEE